MQMVDQYEIWYAYADYYNEAVYQILWQSATHGTIKSAKPGIKIPV